MRIPESWLREHVTLPEDVTPIQVAEALTRAGLEVEGIEYAGSDVTGPVVIGRVLEFVEEPQKNGKIIRWCQVDVGEHNELDESGKSTGRRGIICGANNFAPGDLVVVALPGAVLPGDFAIAARKTYGHISDGMICAVDELGIGSDHEGILILPSVVDGHALTLGEEAAPILHLRDTVYVVELTPDMGYCQSIRGIGREVGQALGARFTDPLDHDVPAAQATGFPVRLESELCPHFVALSIEGIDPSAPTPQLIQRRLQFAGMRPISLAVDITNYVMLLTGQPLHAYDADRLADGIVVRLAQPGEKLTTLDGTERTLAADDLVIADASGAIGLAGVMGGASTEVTETTTRIVLEAAHFDPATVGRTARRHNLTSEASRRFERTVDPAAPHAAARLAATLLTQHAGGTVADGFTVAGGEPEPHGIAMPADLPSRVLGHEISREDVIDALIGAGVTVTAMGESLTLTAPTWRPDLSGPQEMVEEVARKTGIDAIGSELPALAHAGGLSAAQRRRRLVAEQLAARGLVEVLTMPFMDDLGGWGIAEDDVRRQGVRLANPLTEEKPYFRTTLLPGLVDAVQRNMSRSESELALMELGTVAWQTPAAREGVAPLYDTGERPSDEQIRILDGSLPHQTHAVACLWSGAGSWQDAFTVADALAGVYGVGVQREEADHAPFHPGRCARLVVAGTVVGHAGELHPTLVQELALAPRSAALELDLDLLETVAHGPAQIGRLSSFPVTKEDLALVVAESAAAGTVAAALRDGAGELLEDVTLFDVYRSEALGADRKSLAFALRFRAADRTLTQDEVTQAREAAIAAAEKACGAQLRTI